MDNASSQEAFRTYDPMRILVVDDDDTNRLVVRLLMERRGHEIIEASSGQIALETLSMEEIDLVFMDLSMPVMDGFETVRRFRSSTKNTRQIPIIALTAHTTQEDRQKCFEAGMNGLIAKPLNVTSVDTVMELVRDQGTSDSPRLA
jgi:CheY-like chemotaxis protein